MGYYILRRLLLFLPNLALVSLLVFGLGALIPGSPVLNRMPDIQAPAQGGRIQAFDYENEYQKQAKILGLDKAVFYFSVSNLALPDTLHRIFPESRRRGLVELAREAGSWVWVQTLHRDLDHSLRLCYPLPPDAESSGILELERGLRFARAETDLARLGKRIRDLPDPSFFQDNIRASLKDLQDHFQKREEMRQVMAWYIPSFQWYGTDNRYHDWLTRILSGNLGLSIKDGQPVLSPVSNALRWTLLLNISALLGVLCLAVPLGVYAAWREGSAFDRWTHRIVYIFYSIPGFWLASLAITFLTSDTYGQFWHWFSSAGITDYRPDLNFWQNLARLWPDLILPAVILVLPSLAFLFRQTRNAMLVEMEKSYTFAAKARGVREKDLLWRVVFPNAAFPVITMIGGAVPGLISGSLIMEVIFAIPGMGRLMYEAMLSQDWNILHGVILIGTLLVMVSYLITDLLYAWLNPKISLR
jgi:peptide/nickel transport system permease protein